jgi:hypothetical protein
MPMPSYLRRRRHTWFLRLKWPVRLAAYGLSGELIRSLKTGDFRIARHRALTIVLKLETMTSSGNIPKRSEVEGAVRRWIDDSVWRQELKRAETGGIDFFDTDEIEKMEREPARELDGLFRFASNLFAPQEKAAIARALAGDASIEQFRPIIAAAAHEMGMPVDTDTITGRLVERTILRGYATLLGELRQTLIEIPKVPAEAPSPTPPFAPFVFLAHWPDFKQYKLANREWKADTAENAEGTRNLFEKVCPGVTTSQLISDPIASDFKSKIMLLPGKYARGKLKTMPVEKLIGLGRNLPIRDKVQDGTVNKHFSNLAEYWTYLVVQKKISPDAKNPFEGLNIARKKGRKSRNERHNWSPTLEKELFTSPLYSGCASVFRRTQPGSMIFRDALFWMPLLGRTMGTRENEICDALVGDINVEENESGPIWYLEIVGGKDSGSERRVPFADLVLEMGLLEQRVIDRDPGQPLFPELIPQGHGQRRSAAFGDRFAYYKQKTKLHRPRVDYHSFSGNVETDLKNLPAINQAWIDELIGHESIIRRSEGERYTKQILLPILQGLVNSIRINAELSHLRYTGQFGVAAPGRDQELARFVALAEREMRKKARRPDTDPAR